MSNDQEKEQFLIDLSAVFSRYAGDFTYKRGFAPCPAVANAAEAAANHLNDLDCRQNKEPSVNLHWMEFQSTSERRKKGDSKGSNLKPTGWEYAVTVAAYKTFAGPNSQVALLGVVVDDYNDPAEGPGAGECLISFGRFVHRLLTKFNA